MPEFLLAPFARTLAISPVEVLTRLVIAFAFGAAVALVYRATRPADEVSPSFPGTLVLLSVLIAMVTQVIGDSVARAFSLVGALSIVRFRTVVRDTQDTAFVIFSVVVGMACGASDPRVALIGMAVVSAAAFAIRRRATGRAQAFGSEAFDVKVRVLAGASLESAVGAVLDEYVASRRLLGASTAKQGSALDATYLVTFRPGLGPAELVTALNRVETVQGVEILARPFEVVG